MSRLDILLKQTWIIQKGEKSFKAETKPLTCETDIDSKMEKL